MKRIGVFEIDQNCEDQDVRFIMSHMVVLSCEYSLMKRKFIYVAKSNLFDQIEDCAVPKSYEIFIEDDLIFRKIFVKRTNDIVKYY